MPRAVRTVTRTLLDVAGTTVEISTDSLDLTRFLSGLWNETSEPDRSGNPPRRYAVTIAPGAPGVFEGPAVRRPLDRRRPVAHAYQLILSDVLGSMSDCFAFHAACVARQGVGLIVSGPSTFGKTTLSVNLAARGFELVSDDLTLIDRASGRVLPTGRAINLRAGSLDSLPFAAARKARAAVRMRRGHDWTIDPARWFGPPANVVEVGMLVLLRSVEGPGEIRRIPDVTIHLVEGAETVWPSLEATGAVRALRTDSRQPWVAQAQVIDADAFERWRAGRAELIVTVVKTVDRRPDFSLLPVLSPMTRFEGAMELCQEMVNRHPGSVVEDEFRDRGPALVAETARLLGRARCFSLRAGRLADALKVIEQTFETLPRRRAS